jgi:hypothetical protein
MKGRVPTRAGPPVQFPRGKRGIGSLAIFSMHLERRQSSVSSNHLQTLCKKLLCKKRGKDCFKSESILMQAQSEQALAFEHMYKLQMRRKAIPYCSSYFASPIFCEVPK